MNNQGRIITQEEIDDGELLDSALYFKLMNGTGDWAYILSQTPFSYFVKYAYADSQVFGSIYKNEIDKIYLVLP